MLFENTNNNMQLNSQKSENFSPEKFTSSSSNNNNNNNNNNNYISNFNNLSTVSSRNSNSFSNSKKINPNQKTNQYLERFYLKNTNDYLNFFKDKQNNFGLKLKGNKQLNNIPLTEYIKLIEIYRNHIEEEIKNKKLNFIYQFPKPTEELYDLDEIHLTPLPSKSSLFFRTKKEKKDYNKTERKTVMMRILEYTHRLEKNGSISNKSTFAIQRTKET